MASRATGSSVLFDQMLALDAASCHQLPWLQWKASEHLLCTPLSKALIDVPLMAASLISNAVPILASHPPPSHTPSCQDSVQALIRWIPAAFNFNSCTFDFDPSDTWTNFQCHIIIRLGSLTKFFLWHFMSVIGSLLSSHQMSGDVYHSFLHKYSPPRAFCNVTSWSLNDCNWDYNLCIRTKPSPPKKKRMLSGLTLLFHGVKNIEFCSWVGRLIKRPDDGFLDFTCEILGMPCCLGWRGEKPDV